MTVFRTTRGWSAPMGSEEMDVRSRRVSSTHAWKGRWSRRSDISSSGEVELGLGPPGCGLKGRGVDTRGCFLLSLPSSHLRAAVFLGWDFWGPVFVVAVTLGCWEVSVTGWDGGFVLGMMGLWPWQHAPLGWRDSTPRPGPSAQHRPWPAVLSERQSGLWRRSFVHDRASALQERPSLLSTSHSPASSPCGFPCGHSTGAVPAGYSNYRRGGNTHTLRIGCVSAVLLHVSKALALQWAFRGHVRFDRHSRVILCWEIAILTPQDLAPLVQLGGGWEGGPWRGPGRDGRNTAVWLPGHECSGIPAPPGRRSQAYPYPRSLPEAGHMVVREREGVETHTLSIEGL